MHTEGCMAVYHFKPFTHLVPTNNKKVKDKSCVKRSDP